MLWRRHVVGLSLPLPFRVYHPNRVRKALAEKSREVDRAKDRHQRNAARSPKAAPAKGQLPKRAARSRGAAPATEFPAF